MRAFISRPIDNACYKHWFMELIELSIACVPLSLLD